MSFLSNLQGSINLYLKFYLCLHIISLVTIFILPKYVRGESRSRDSNATVRLAGAGHVKDSAATECASATALVAGNDLKESGEEEEMDKHAQCKVNTPTQQQLSAAELINKHNRTIEQQTTNKHSEQSNNVNLRPQHHHEQQQQQPSQEKKPVLTCARDAVSVPHDQCEMDQLSSKLKEKLEAETKNIEEFIDKTVTETVSGIVEFKNDLMRDIEFPKLKLPGSNTGNNGSVPLDSATVGGGLRKRNISSVHDNGTASPTPGNPQSDHHAVIEENGSAFLKKEIDVINAVVQQANVLPAVLSNGHAK